MKKTFLLVAFIFVVMTFMSACSSTHPLIGKWAEEGNDEINYEFKKNGTVIVTVYEKVDELEWEETSDSDITLRGGMLGSYYFSYEINGKTAIFSGGIYAGNPSTFKKIK